MPRQKTIRAFRGRDRKAIKTLLRGIKLVKAVDERRDNQAGVAGVQAVLFQDHGAQNYVDRMNDVEERCVTALAQTLSLQTVVAPNP